MGEFIIKIVIPANNYNSSVIIILLDLKNESFYYTELIVLINKLLVTIGIFSMQIYYNIMYY